MRDTEANITIPDAARSRSVTVTPILGIGSVTPGSDLIDHLDADGALSSLNTHSAQTVLVLAQKIVSKAEGRLANLADFQPSTQARKLAAETGKDARLVEAILSESTEVIRSAPGVLIVKDRRGLVLANAGIDRSNIDGDDDTVLLLPVDPDGSAAALRKQIEQRVGKTPAIIISDSLGRAWRLGTMNIAIGAAGIPSIIDRSGQPDRHGRILESTVIGFADSVAAAAGLVLGEAAEGVPAAIVTGLEWTDVDRPASAAIRPSNTDLFL